jgi:hypothetical protein
MLNPFWLSRRTHMVCHAGPTSATWKPATARRWQHYMVRSPQPHRGGMSVAQGKSRSRGTPPWVIPSDKHPSPRGAAPGRAKMRATPPPRPSPRVGFPTSGTPTGCGMKKGDATQGSTPRRPRAIALGYQPAAPLGLPSDSRASAKSPRPYGFERRAGAVDDGWRVRGLRSV